MLQRGWKAASRIFIALALVAGVVVGVSPAEAATTVGGWEEPVPMGSPAAGWLASGCGGSTAYETGLYHIGRDYWGAVGTSVKAIGDGVVLANQNFGTGFARALFVKHTSAAGIEFVVLYGHVNSALTADTVVHAGDQIATLAELTGVDSHLHLGLVPGTSYPSTNWGRLSCPIGGTNQFVDPVPFLESHPRNSTPNPQADLLVHNSNWAKATSTGSSFVGNGLSFNWGLGDQRLLGDVTGDGFADYVTHNPSNNTWAVAVNNGSGEFNGAGSGTWLSGWGGGSWATLANISGDAKMELVLNNGGAWYVATSNGSSFSGGALSSLTWGMGDWRAFVDVTGDGVADYVTHNPSANRYDVSTNNGSGSFGSTNTGPWLSGWGAGDWVGIANVDGVSGADLVIHAYSSGVHHWDIAYSNGHGFAGGPLSLNWGKGDFAGLADVGGDGKADIVVHDPSTNTFAVATYNSTSGQFNGAETGTWLSGWSAGDWVGLANLD